MKLWISMLVLLLSVVSLCVWDSMNTTQVFNNMEKKSNYIYQTIINEDISNKELQNEIFELNKFWTQKMDTLSISISRKDLQPISDYLQYLCSAITNQNQEDAVTYSRLLNYNVLGVKETTGVSWINLL